MNMVSRERVALADLGASAVAGLGFGLRSIIRGLQTRHAIYGSRQVTCMSPTLPTLFRHATGYRHQLTLTPTGSRREAAGVAAFLGVGST
jgi:hypothetical protein